MSDSNDIVVDLDVYDLDEPDRSHIDVQALAETMACVNAAADSGLWAQEVWITTEEDYVNPDDKFTFKNVEYCGTAGCFAGWSALLDGWKPVTNRDVRERGLHSEDYLIKDGALMAWWEIEEWARKRLGLDYDDAAALFHADNELDDLRTIVDDLCFNALRAKQEEGDAAP